MRWLRALTALGFLASAGCGDDARQVDVGVHALVFDIPTGWEYVDHGSEHLLRKGYAQISINDRGAATIDGDVLEVEAAWDLRRQGDLEAAQDRLRRLPVPRSIDATHDVDPRRCPS